MYRLYLLAPKRPPSHNPLSMRIYIHGMLSQEADEGDTAAVGQFDGQTGGSGDGSNAGDTRQQGFLDDLE